MRANKPQVHAEGVKLETLEPRLLLSADLATLAPDGTLTLRLTDNADVVTLQQVALQGSANVAIDVTVNGITERWGSAVLGVSRIVADGLGGSDDFSLLGFRVPVSIVGGSGNDSISASGDILSGGDVSLESESVAVGATISTRSVADGTTVLGHRTAPSTGPSGNLALRGESVNLADGAALLTQDTRAGIVNAAASQTASDGGWLAGREHLGVEAARSSGAGGGMRVDISVNASGAATATLVHPGWGYAVGDTVVFEEPQENLGFFNAAPFTNPKTLTLTVTAWAGNLLVLASEHHNTYIGIGVERAEPTLTVGNATLSGENVALVAVASTAFEAEGAEQLLQDFGIEGLSGVFGFVDSKASARIVLGAALDGGLAGGAANVSGEGHVTLRAQAAVGVDVQALGNRFGAAAAHSVGEATATIGSGATVNAGATLEVDARLVNNTNVTARLISNSSSLGVGVLVQASDALAAIGSGAQVFAHDLSVSGQVENGVSVDVSPFELTSGESSGMTVAVSVLDSSATAYVDSSLSVAGNIAVAADSQTENQNSSVAEPKGALGSQIGRFTNSKPDEKSGGDKDFELSAAIAVSIADNAADAHVGPNAVLRAGGGIAVGADLVDSMRLSATSQAEGADKGLSAAVSVGDTDNDAIAYIADGADVAAAKTISLSANTTVPDPLPDSVWDLVAEGDDADAASTIYALLLTGSSALETPVTNLLTTYVHSAATQEASGDSTGSTSRLTLAGSFSFLAIDNDALAWVGAGAKLNIGLEQGSPYSSPEQRVDLDASNRITTYNLGGIFSFPNPGDLKKNDQGKWDFSALNPLGATGTNAFGGTYNQVNYDSTVVAEIRSDAQVLAQTDVGLSATSTTFNLSINIAGGQAEKAGIEGAFSWLKEATNTIAQVHDGASVTARNLGIGANTDSRVYNVVGGAVYSKNLGVGFAIGITDVERSTLALLGDRVSPTPDASTIVLSGNLTISATNLGHVQSYSVAAAVANASTQSTGGEQGGGDPGGQTPSRADDSDPLDGVSLPLLFGDAEPQSGGGGGGSQPAQGKSGIALAGDIAVNLVADTAKAFVNDSGTLGVPGRLDLTASNTTEVVNAAGAVAIALADENKTSLGVAGAFTVNVLTGSTEAFVAHAVLGNVGALALDAERTGRLYSVAAGGAGAPKKGGIALAGSAAVNQSDHDTLAYLDDVSSSANGGVGGAISLTAHDDTNLLAIAGSLAYGGRAGFGASVAFNDVTNTVAAQVLHSHELGRQGALTLSASTDNDLVAVAGSIGASGQGYAGSGTVALNLVDGSVLATVEDSSDTAASTGSISLSARDDSNLVAVSGAVGAAKNAALGAALAWNDVGVTVRSKVDGSTLHSSSTLLLSAHNDTVITGVAVGVAGAKNAALAASAAYNQIDNTTEALASSTGTVSAPGAVLLTARDDAQIVAVAGGVGGAQSVAVGAALAYNDIGNTTRAAVHQATVSSSAGAVGLAATTATKLIAVGLGASGAQSLAIGGSVVINKVANTTEALVDLGAHVNASTGFSLQAADSSALIVVAGGGAGAGSAAIGAAAASTELTNTLKASVDAATVNVTQGGVEVSARFLPPSALPQLSAIDLSSVGISLQDLDEVDDAMPLTASQIISVALAGSGAGTFAGGAALSLNWLRNSIEASINQAASVTARDDILVSASDQPEITSFSGIGAGAGSAAIGAALTLNYIGGDPDDPGSTRVSLSRAQISASTVQSTLGQVQVHNRFDPHLFNFAIGGAGSGGFAATGSIGVNLIKANAAARIVGGQVTARLDVDVDAQSTPLVIGGSGNASGSGGVAAAAAVSTNDVAIALGADITESTVTSTQGDVLVTAHIERPGLLPNLVLSESIDAQIWSLAIGGAGAGAAALAGSLSLNWIRNDVDAHISGGSVHANLGAIDVHAEDNATINALAGGVSLAGGAAGGAAIAWNYLGGDPSTPGADDRNTTEAAIRGGSHGAKTVDVRAENRSGINTIVLAGTFSGAASLSGAVGLNFIRNQVLAGISDGAVVTASGDVDPNVPDIAVNALDDPSIRSLAGQLSVSGAVGAGVALAFNDIADIASAEVRGATLIAQRDGIDVHAQSSGSIESLAAGASVAGAVSAAGSVSIGLLASSTSATVADATLQSEKHIAVRADDSAVVDLAGGTVSGSLVAGLGVTVSFAQLTNTTTAQLLGGSSNARGTTSVLAHSTSDAAAKTATIGAGTVAGAGSISIVQVAPHTVAAIDRGNGGIARVNQDLSYRNAQQDVTVLADQDVKVDDITGGLSASLLGGIGASLDLISVRGGVEARIGGGSLVQAGRAVLVQADGNKDIDSIVVALAGTAGFALNGAISLVSVGTGLSSDGRGQADLVSGDANSGLSAGPSSFKTYNKDGSQKNLSSGSAPSANDAISADSLASAVRARIGPDAQVTSGGSTSVLAHDVVRVDTGIGAGTFGAAAIGGAVSLVKLGGLTESVVQTGSVLDAGGAITVQGTADNRVNAIAVAGTGGLVGLGAQVAIVEDFSAQRAALDSGAAIVRAAGVSVHAGATRDHDATAMGLTFGIAAAGAAFGKVNIGGSIVAETGAVAIGQDPGKVVGNVSVLADGLVDAKGTAKAVNGGVLAGGYNEGNATIGTLWRAEIGDDAQIHVEGAIDVAAAGSSNAEAAAHGINAGVAAIGVSLANALVQPVVTTLVGPGALLLASGNVTLQARHNVRADGSREPGLRRAYATADASGGGIASGQGAVAAAVSQPSVLGSVDGADITSEAGDVSVLARSFSDALAVGSGANYGGVAIGYIESQAVLRNDTRAEVLGQAQLRAFDDLNVLASSGELGQARSTGNSGGLIDISKAVSSVHISEQGDGVGTRARIGVGADLVAGDELGVQALRDTTARWGAHADASGLGVGSAIENTVTLSLLTGAEVGASGAADASTLRGRIVTVSASAGIDAQPMSNNDRAKSNAAVGFPDATTHVSTTSTVQAKLWGNAGLTGDEQVNLRAGHAKLLTAARAVAEANGFASDAEAEATNNLTTTALVDADAGASIATRALDVRATAPDSVSFSAVADNDAGTVLLPFGSDPVTQRHLQLDRRIEFDAHVLVSPVSPEVVVAADGSVTARGPVTVDASGPAIVIGDIVNQETTQGTLTFSVPGNAYDTLKLQPGWGHVIGTTARIAGRPDFDAALAFDRIDIVNASAKDLRIGNIQVRNTAGVGTANVTVSAADKAGFVVPAIGTEMVLTDITIANTNPVFASDVLLAGRIQNPDGVTDVAAAAGDVLNAATPQSLQALQTGSAVFEAPLGRIGTDAAPIHIQATSLDAVAGTGLVIDQTAGNLALHRAWSSAGTLVLSAAGSILDADAPDDTALADLAAPVVRLTSAGGSLGTNSQALETDADALQALARGDVNLTEVAGAMRVLQVASDIGSVLLQTRDSAAAGEDIVLGAGAAIRALQGSVTLASGDDVSIDALAEISAGLANGRSLRISGDVGDADAGIGSTLDLQGALSAARIDLIGSAAADLIVLRGSSAPTFIDAGASNDLLRIGSNASTSGIDGSRLQTLRAALTIDGGDDAGVGSGDTLELSDDADTSNNEGRLTATTLSGLGMGGAIAFSRIETLTLTLGSGADRLNLLGMAAGTSAGLNLGGGDDTLATDDPALATKTGLNAIDGVVIVAGQGGSDRLLLSDATSGAPAANQGLLLGASLHGLGMGGDDNAAPNLNAGLFFDGFESLTLTLGGAADALELRGVALPTTVEAGGGVDSILIGGLDPGASLATLAQPLRLDAGADGGTLRIGAGVASELTLSRDSATLGRLQAVGAGADALFSSFSDVSITLGSGADRLTLLDTVAPLQATLGEGADIVIVRNLSHATTLTLGDGGDAVTVYATTATLDIADAGGTGADSLTIDATAIATNTPDNGNLPSLTGSAGQGVVSGLTSARVAFDGIEALTVALGAGNNLFAVDHALASTAVRIDGGDGDDEFRVNTIGATRATVLNGQGGFDTATVRIAGAPVAGSFTQLGLDVETLVVDNRSSNVATAWSVVNGQTIRAGALDVISAGGAQQVRILGGAASADSLEIVNASGASTDVLVDGRRVELQTGAQVLVPVATWGQADAIAGIDFDDYGGGSPYVEDNLRVQLANPADATRENETSPALRLAAGKSLVLTGTTGQLSLSSLMLASDGNAPASVTLSGIRPAALGGGTVQTTLPGVPGRNGGALVFQRYAVVDPAFAALQSLTITANGAAVFIDNVEAAATAPSLATASTPVVPASATAVGTYYLLDGDNGVIVLDTNKNGLRDSSETLYTPATGFLGLPFVVSTVASNGVARGNGVFDAGDPIVQFRFAGDLVLNSGVNVKGLGTRAISLDVANDVQIGENVIFNFSASNRTPGAGGGGGGATTGNAGGGFGGDGGAGGGNAGLTSDGGAGGGHSGDTLYGGGGGFSGVGGSTGFAGQAGNTGAASSGGANGALASGAGPGGAVGSAGLRITSGGGGPGDRGSGGRGGDADGLGDGDNGGGGGWGGNGVTGASGATGGSGGVGSGGKNQSTSGLLTGGSGGGSGGGGGSGSGGMGGGGGGSGGGGGGGGAGAVFNIADGGHGGQGGVGGRGGDGADGGAGGAGGAGGGGGGAIELIARGRLTLASSANFSAAGGAGSGGSAGSVGTAGFNLGQNTDRNSGLNAGRTNGGDRWDVDGGDGGFGGEGGVGGVGGLGGPGGPGGAGAGGSGGTVKLVGSVLSLANALVNVPGGLGAAGTVSFDDGGAGRFILGSNTATGTYRLSTGAGLTTVAGSSGINPYVSGGSSTPFIAGARFSNNNLVTDGLLGGAEAFGLSSLDPSDFSLGTLPSGAVAAVVRLDLGPAGMAIDYSGYDLLAFVNLTGSTQLVNPKIGVAAASATNVTLADLKLDGLGALRTLNNLDPNKVWVTLVPQGTLDVAASFEFGGRTFSLGRTAMGNGAVRFLQITPATAATPLAGLEELALSADGRQAYATNAARDAVVVINTVDGSQRQIFANGVDGVTGLDRVSAITVSSDGLFVYATSPTQGGLEFKRDPLTGNLTPNRLLDVSPTTARQVWVAGDGLTARFFQYASALTNFPDYSGTPVLTRLDGSVNQALTNGSFAAGVGSDNFAVQWQGQLQVATAGLVTFYVTSDDGGRLYVDGNLVVPDANPLHSFQTRSAQVNLGAGLHTLRLDFFDAAGAAGVTLEYATATQSRRLLTTPPSSGFGAAALAGPNGALYTAGSSGVAQQFASSGGWQTSGLADGLALNADGTRLAVLTSSTDTLRLVNTATGALVGAALGGAALGLDGASGAAFSADGQYLYVSGSVGNSVAVFRHLSTGLSWLATYTNGDGGVGGIVGASDVRLTPDQRFVLVSGRDSNAVAVFARNPTSGLLTPAQTLRSGHGGANLFGPANLATTADGALVFVAAAGDDPSAGGLVKLSNLALGQAVPAPRTEVTTFDNLESLSVTLSGGDDALQLRNASQQDGAALPLALSTGGGNDRVLLSDLAFGAAKTMVDLGPGVDDAQLRSTRAGAVVSIQGGDGADLIRIDGVGVSANVTVTGGSGADLVQVAGAELPLSSALRVIGDSADAATDTLLYDPRAVLPFGFRARNAGGVVVGTPDQNGGDLQRGQGSGVNFVASNGLVSYAGLDVVTVIAAPVVTLNSASTNEGQPVNLLASAVPLGTGNALAGPLAWDLDGDGQFDDGTSASGAPLALSWAQLVDLGLGDNGIYPIAVRAVNGDQRSTDAAATLTVNNVAPTLTLGSSGATVTLGSDWRLDFSASDPGDDQVTSWLVNWGDGNQERFGADASSATHVYQSPGARTVIVQVFDDDSGSSVARQATTNVTVLASGAALITGGPYAIAEGQPLQLLGSAPGTPAPALSWSVNGSAFGAQGASGANPVLSWAQLQSLGVSGDGAYTVVLRAEYANGTLVSQQTSLAVANTAPAVSIATSVPSVQQGGAVTVTISAADPSLADQAALAYSVEFGNSGVFLPMAGTSIAVPAQHLANSGLLEVRGRVSDGLAVVDASTTLTITDRAPVLNVVGAASVVEGAAYRLQLSASDLGQDTIATWRIDWGDGNVQVHGGASADLEHRYLDNGQRVIQVEASDAFGSYRPAQGLAVQVLNAAPTLLAASEGASDEGGVARFNLELGDAGVLDTHTLTIDWGDGTPQPSLPLPAGTSRYTLEHVYLNDAPGGYTLNFTLMDDDGGSTAVPLVQTVHNRAPEVLEVVPSVAQVIEGQSFTLSGRVADVGAADSLAVSIDWGDGSTPSLVPVDPLTRSFSVVHTYADDDPSGTAQDPVTITATARDEHGAGAPAATPIDVHNAVPKITGLELEEQRNAVISSATLRGSVTDAGVNDAQTLLVDWGDGSSDVVNIPAGAQRDFVLHHEYAIDVVPGYRISIAYSDDDGGSGTVTLDTIGFTTNRAPLAGNDQAGTDRDESVQIAVLANDSDPDGDALLPYVLTLPAHGQLRNLGDGRFEYTPDAGFDGHDGFTYRVSDGELRSNVATVAITVRGDNEAPVLKPVADVSVAEGGLVQFQLEASDANGDALVFSVVSGQGGIDSQGRYSFAPTDGDATLPVTVRVSDGQAFAERSFTIHIDNVAPTLTVTGASAIADGSPLVLTLAASDPGQDSISAWRIDWGDGQIDTLPGSATLASHRFALTGGSFVVQASATDEDGQWPAAPHAVNVAAVPLQVLAMQPTASGFDLRFNQAFDLATIAQFVAGGADVQLVGARVGSVAGTLLVDADHQGLSFVRTGAALTPDQYSFRLISGPAGFHAAGGPQLALDGNRDGTPGDDHVAGFIITAPEVGTVSLPDFMRGPGQPVNVPASSSGLPVNFTSAAGGQRQLSFDIGFDPALLTISGASAAATLPQGTTVQFDLLPAAQGLATARLTVTLPQGSTLAAGTQRLVDLQAMVSAGAPYGAVQRLDLLLRSVDGVVQSSVLNPADDAVHVVGFFGDGNRDARYSSADVTLLQRVITRTDPGFAAWNRVDPVIVGDIAGGGTLNSIDGTRLAQEVAFLNGTLGSADRPEIPPIPAGFVPPLAAPPNKAILASTSATDASASADAVQQVRSGDAVQVTVPARLASAAQPLQLRVAYDASRFEFESLERGDARGDYRWDVAAHGEGELAIHLRGLDSVEGSAGSLLDLRWRVREGARSGAAPIDVHVAALAEGPAPWVQLQPPSDAAAVAAQPARGQPAPWLAEMLGVQAAGASRLPALKVVLPRAAI